MKYIPKFDSEKLPGLSEGMNGLTSLGKNFFADTILKIAKLKEDDFIQHVRGSAQEYVATPDYWAQMHNEFNEARIEMTDLIILIYENKIANRAIGEAIDGYELSLPDHASEKLQLCYRMMGYSVDDAEFMVLNEKASIYHALDKYYSAGLNEERSQPVTN